MGPYHKAAVDANAQAQAHENKSNLSSFRGKEAVPKAHPRTDDIDDGADERGDKDVLVGKVLLHEMRDDHLADRVGVDEADEQRKRDKVMTQDCRLEAQVRNDHDPGAEGREQTEEWFHGALAALAAHAVHVHDADDGVEEQHQGAVDDIPRREGEVVDRCGDQRGFRDSHTWEHGVVPEAATAFEGGNHVDEADGENALDGAGDDAQS